MAFPARKRIMLTAASSAQFDAVPTRPFPFLKLPPEIRFLVYEQLPRIIHHHHISIDNRVSLILVTRSIPTSILATCKTVHAEANQIVQSAARRFILESPPRMVAIYAQGIRSDAAFCIFHAIIKAVAVACNRIKQGFTRPEIIMRSAKDHLRLGIHLHSQATLFLMEPNPSGEISRNSIREFSISPDIVCKDDRGVDKFILQAARALTVLRATPSSIHVVSCSPNTDDATPTYYTGTRTEALEGRLITVGLTLAAFCAQVQGGVRLTYAGVIRRSSVCENQGLKLDEEVPPQRFSITHDRLLQADIPDKDTWKQEWFP
ncbi:hypothetical protein BDV95DRAFT_63297 [Massariosphaeria phaeospora]|uniref:F-box domain-containing protein n=1 Tax=Massariosphaeria phaeospora TaxID=100035 RepID=A0A7C8IDN1_9PLEO|nr:hypothetical protein BDV95DRAFT_63297 [Massariosphaeria phaeospora]